MGKVEIAGTDGGDRQICDQVAVEGHQGFEFTTAHAIPTIALKCLDAGVGKLTEGVTQL